MRSESGIQTRTPTSPYVVATAVGSPLICTRHSRGFHHVALPRENTGTPRCSPEVPQRFQILSHHRASGTNAERQGTRGQLTVRRVQSQKYSMLPKDRVLRIASCIQKSPLHCHIQTCRVLKDQTDTVLFAQKHGTCFSYSDRTPMHTRQAQTSFCARQTQHCRPAPDLLPDGGVFD